MSTTADIKNGSILNFKNSRMKVVEFQHVKPGKGPAFVRTKLKDIQSGKVIDQTFNAGVKLEFIRVTSSQFQYLYKDATSYIFMDNQTFNQVEVSELMMQDGQKFIKEGENIERSLKKYKKKFEKTKVMKKLRANKQFEKPSISRRQQVIKASYRQKMKSAEE